MVVANSTMWLPGIDRQNPLARGLVGHWPIWEGPGSATIGDVANPNPKALRGTLTNMDARADWIPSGKRELGWALDFGGANEAVVVGKPSALNDVMPVSYSLWLNTDLSQTGQILYKTRRHIQISPAGRARFSAAHDSATLTIESAIAVQSNQWHHLVVTWTGGGDADVDIAFWLDGQQLGYTGAGTDATGYRSDASMDLSLSATGTTFKGQLALASVFDRILIPSEIETLYRTPNALTTRRAKVFAAAAGAIMNQLQGSNVGADLYNGAMIV